MSFEYITPRLIQTIANISILTVGKAVYTFWNLLLHFQINQFAGSPEHLQTFFKQYKSQFSETKCDLLFSLD